LHDPLWNGFCPPGEGGMAANAAGSEQKTAFFGEAIFINQPQADL